MNDKIAWDLIDPLGEALHFLRMRSVFYCCLKLTEPWGLALPTIQSSLVFYAITNGHAWLQADNAEPQLLQAGDFALMAHGQAHQMTSAPEAETEDFFDLPRQQVSERFQTLTHGQGGAATHLVCGAVRFDHPVAHHLVNSLPKIICIKDASSPHFERMQNILQFMAAEAITVRPGGEAVITRLADVLVIQAIRAWIDNDPAAQTGWLGALQDKQIGRALALVHRDPARAWTLDLLAAQVAMSRSSFAARFTQLTGVSAMHYVTRWRMQLALACLKEKEITLIDLATRFGYQSEAAFGRAFKRFMGFSPGAVRRTE
jgi:AraC-like DNA-binding protein